MRIFNSSRRAAMAGVAAAALAGVLAACGGSSTKTAATTATTPASPASSATSGSSAPANGVTIATANVSGLGQVLVNGQGRTLYLLSSEKGGKLTCTAANGCTTYWPDTELPAGVSAATAGTGAQASRLGTVKDAKGSLHVTYGGWPIYTYAGDSAAGQAHGQGIISFGGTWYVLSPAGTPITTAAGGAGASTTSTSGGGYHY